MDNFTAAPEDEYEVLIEGELSPEPGPCPALDAGVLSAGQARQLCSAVLALGLLANAAALGLLARHGGLRRAESVYLLNVALSNVWSLLALPHGALGAGAAACRALLWLGFLGLYSEALLNGLLTAHGGRLASALGTVRGSVASSALAWAAAVLAALPEVLLHEAPPEGRRDRCSLGRPLLLAPARWKSALAFKMSLLVLGVPLSTFLFCYVRMGVARGPRARPFPFPRLPFAVTAAFLLMWAPYNITLVLATFKDRWSLPGCKGGHSLARAVQVTEIIATVHSCVNPLLVCLDRAFRKSLCGWCPGCQDPRLGPRQEPALGWSREGQQHCTAL